MNLATLHGRPAKVGDRLFYLPSQKWCVIALRSPGTPWVTPAEVTSMPHKFAWDEPPRVDISKIAPPLGFTRDGYPIRVDSIMYCNTLQTAVEVVRKAVVYLRHVMYVRQPRTGNVVSVPLESLSYDFPNEPPKPVVKEKTRWFNIYANDEGRSSYQTFSSEAEAKKFAKPGCQGQGYFTHRFAVPAV